MTRLSLSKIALIAGLATAWTGLAVAADDIKSATLVIKATKPGVFGAIFVVELTNTIAKDVFVDFECTGSIADQNITFGPWKTTNKADTMIGPVLVDAGKTVTKDVSVKMNALADFETANPGKPIPLPTKTDCKIIKVEVMG
ncbi:MAG: hypothetical protein ABL897_01360 [Hyphomicrobium sp.]